MNFWQKTKENNDFRHLRKKKFFFNRFYIIYIYIYYLTFNLLVTLYIYSYIFAND